MRPASGALRSLRNGRNSGQGVLGFDLTEPFSRPFCAGHARIPSPEYPHLRMIGMMATATVPPSTRAQGPVSAHWVVHALGTSMVPCAPDGE